MKKKILSILLTAFLGVSALTGCNGGGNGVKTLSVYIPDGTPFVAAARLMQNFGIEGYKFEFNLTNSEVVNAMLMSGDADIAIAPINMCARYGNLKDYKFGGVSIWGAMSIVSSESDVTELSHLGGKTLYAFAKGNVPGQTLLRLLEEAGLEPVDDVDLNGEPTETQVKMVWKADGPALKDLIVAYTGDPNNANLDAVKYAMLPEPVATAIKGATANGNGFPQTEAVINLNKVWKDKYETANGFPQAGVVFKSGLLNSDKAAVDAFLGFLEYSCWYANNYPEEAGNLAKALGSAAIAAAAPIKAASAEGRLNFTFTSAADAKADVHDYLNKLTKNGTENMAIIGDKLPADSFYYGYEA